MKAFLEDLAVFLLLGLVIFGLIWVGTRMPTSEPEGTALLGPPVAEIDTTLARPGPVCPDSADFLRQKPSPTAKIPHAEADSQESLPPAGICWADPAGEGEICTYWLGA